MINLLSKPNKWVILGIVAASLAMIWDWSGSLARREVLAELDISKGEVVEVVSENVVDVTQVNTFPAPVSDGEIVQQTLLVRLENGEVVGVSNDRVPVRKGAEVYAAKVFEPEENQAGYYVVDAVRTNGLMWLLVAFIAVVVLVSGRLGAYALVGLLFSFAVIFEFILPGILAGGSPVLIGLAGAISILVVAIYVSHGFNKKSLAALVGISAALVIVGAATSYLSGALYFSGFGAEESIYLNFSNSAINLVGLMIAGVLIVAIGILDDAAITQSSIVFKLHQANPSMSNLELFKRSMDVGRDHIAAVVNTLVLAYVGAALPLLLLLTMQNYPVGFTVNQEVIAEEVFRTLIASIGLVLAIPITTAVAIFLKDR